MSQTLWGSQDQTIFDMTYRGGDDWNLHIDCLWLLLSDEIDELACWWGVLLMLIVWRERKKTETRRSTLLLPGCTIPYSECDSILLASTSEHLMLTMGRMSAADRPDRKILFREVCFDTASLSWNIPWALGTDWQQRCISPTLLFTQRKRSMRRCQLEEYEEVDAWKSYLDRCPIA